MLYPWFTWGLELLHWDRTTCRSKCPLPRPSSRSAVWNKALLSRRENSSISSSRRHCPSRPAPTRNLGPNRGERMSRQAASDHNGSYNPSPGRTRVRCRLFDWSPYGRWTRCVTICHVLACLRLKYFFFLIFIFFVIF